MSQGRARISFFAILLAVCVAPSSVRAGPADLDATFGTGGVAILDYPYLWDDASYADGRLALLVGEEDFIPQYHVTPRRVVRLNVSGQIDPSFTGIENFAAFVIESIAVTPSGRLMTLQSRYQTPDGEFRATRHLVDGTPDVTFGNGGVAVVSEFAYTQDAHFPDGQIVQTPLAVDDAERAHVAIRAFANRGSDWSTWIDRLNASGAPVTAIARFDGTGMPLYQSLLFDPQERLVALVYRNERAFGGPDVSGPALMRFVDGVPDQSFGVKGLAFQGIANWSDGAFSIGSAYDGHAATADGGYVVVGRIRESVDSDVVAVARFTSQGTFDRSFGEGGVARIRFSGAASRMNRAMVEAQRDGNIIVAASLVEDGVLVVGLARLTAAGKPDTRFAAGGVKTFWTDEGTTASSLHLQQNGRIVIVGGVNRQPYFGRPRPAVFRFNGGDLAQPRALRERIAVEYVHAGYGHYFLTADIHEIVALDSHPARGWLRTGRSFAVWDDNDASLAQVCRFWSDQSFAPKSSHVYTPYADECALLKAGATWTFERNAFAVRLPEGASRGCAVDARPLYRAYNNAMGGAPNHRYTVDEDVLDEMVALGWTAEGAPNTRVFACVPHP